MSENEEKHEEQDEKQNASVLDVNVNTEKQDEDPAEETATAEKGAAETEETAAAVKEIQDKFVRLQADFANFKKRSSAERLQVANVIRGEMVADILPVIDNFERALQVPQEKQNDDVKPFIEGCEMIYKQLAGVLEKTGVTKIEALDKPFDPNYHQAVMRVPAEGVPDNTIVEVLQDGYLLGDKTIRPAMVKVAFNG